MDSRTMPNPPHLNATRFSRLFLAAAALFLFLGCAGVKDLSGQRDPKELYDTAMKSYLDERYEEAETAFRVLLEEHPLSSYSLDAQLMLGDVCYSLERFDDASSYYTNFVALHPVHPRAAYALFQKGMSHFKEVLSYDRDQTATRKALFAFEDLVANYPGTPYYEKSKELVSFLRKRLADREFYVAHFYYKSGNYKGALGRLREILRSYPDEGLTDKTLYYIGESYRRLGETKLANEAYTTLIRSYPESPFVRDAKEVLDKG